MRQPRKLKAGARYHVSARANRREMIMDSPGMKALFIDVVRRAKKRYSFRIENFCVMGNHYHLIIQPMHGSCLSRIMQWIMSVFAIEYNRIFGLTGHVWGERFFSRIINCLQEYIQIFQYIDENPIKAGLLAKTRLWLFGGLYHRLCNSWELLDPIPSWLVVLLETNVTLLTANPGPVLR